MHSLDAQRLLAVIRSGDFTAILPLSDLLCEEGREREAVLLRKRLSRWRTSVSRYEQSLRDKCITAVLARHLDCVRWKMNRYGAHDLDYNATFVAVCAAESNLLLAYVSRLFSPRKTRTIRKRTVS